MIRKLLLLLMLMFPLSAMAVTPGVVPAADGEGSIGRTTNKWGNGYFKILNGDNVLVGGISVTNLVGGTGTVSAAQISKWDLASLQAIFASNGVVSLQGSNGVIYSWATAISNIAQNAQDTSGLNSNVIITLQGSNDTIYSQSTAISNLAAAAQITGMYASNTVGGLQTTQDILIAQSTAISNIAASALQPAATNNCITNVVAGPNITVGITGAVVTVSSTASGSGGGDVFTSSNNVMTGTLNQFTNAIALGTNLSAVGRITLAPSVSTNAGIRLGEDAGIYRSDVGVLGVIGSAASIVGAWRGNHEGVENGDFTCSLYGDNKKKYRWRNSSGLDFMTLTNSAGTVVLSSGNNTNTSTNAFCIAAGTNLLTLGSGGPVDIVGVFTTNGAALATSAGGGATDASTNYFLNAANLTNLVAAGIITNGTDAFTLGSGTFTGLVLSTIDHTVDAPSTDELVTAGFVRSLAMSGAEWWFTSVVSNFGGAGGTKTTNFVALATDIPTTPFTNSIASPVASSTYLAGGISTQSYGILRSPVTFEMFMNRVGGSGASVLPVHPELYYVYNGTTNHLGDWEAANQTVTVTTPTKYTYTVAFPEPVITGGSIRVIGYLKSGTVSGPAAGLNIYGGGTYTSHMDIPGVTIAEVDKAYDMGRMTNWNGSVVDGNLNLSGYNITNGSANLANLNISGVITQSLAAGTNYFAGSLGVGTNLPSTALEINSAINTQAAGSATIKIIGNNNKERFAAFGPSGGFLQLGSFRGSYESPLAITITNTMAGIQFMGSTGGLRFVVGGLLNVAPSANWSETSTPTYLSWAAAPVGSTTRTEKFRVLSDGNFGINTTTPATKLDVNGSATIRGNLDMQGGYVTNAGTAFQPFFISPSASQDVSIAYTYQKLIATNPVSTIYCPSLAQVGSNSARFVYLEIEKGTNSLTLSSANCVTNGTGSVNSMVVTNSGVSSYRLLFPCAGTNLNTVWKWFQL